MVQPVGNHRCFTATFITSDDQWLILHLYLVLLLLYLWCLFIATLLLFLLLLLLLHPATRWVHLSLAHCHISLHEIVQVVEVRLVTIKLSNTIEVRISV